MCCGMQRFDGLQQEKRRERAPSAVCARVFQCQVFLTICPPLNPLTYSTTSAHKQTPPIHSIHCAFRWPLNCGDRRNSWERAQ